MSSQEAVDEAAAEALRTGAFGSSTARYIKDVVPALPEGGSLHDVQVRIPMHHTVVTYKQPFGPAGLRLCLLCIKPTPQQPPADAVLASCMELFCGPACESSYYLKASSGSIRRALFKLERGVCQACGLDCHALVVQLQATRRGTADWRRKR